MKILFPSEPFSPKEVDSSLKDEYDAAKLIGFKVFLFDHDEFVKTNKFNTNLPLSEGDGQEQILLRGWMLKREQYFNLFKDLYCRGYDMINTPVQYINCHHFPEYYNFISQITPKSTWGPNWDKDVIDTARKYMFLDGESDLFIKDYVKSEKGNPDLFILKKELTLDEFHDRVVRFIEARGKLFNEGIVFKKVVNLKKYDGENNEWRLFFLENKLLICNQNSNNPIEVTSPQQSFIGKIKHIASLIQSNFFTIDIAEKEDGTWIVLEMGDGQVSGLPLKSDSIGFYNKINMELHVIENKNG